jgi:hypothetical protein
VARARAVGRVRRRDATLTRRAGARADSARPPHDRGRPRRASGPAAPHHHAPPGCSGRPLVGATVWESCAPLPAEGRRAPSGAEPLTHVRRMDGAPGTPAPGRWLAPGQRTGAPAVGPRLEGVGPHGWQGQAWGTPPVHGAAAGPARRTNRPPALPTARRREDRADAPHDALRRRLQIPWRVPLGAAPVAPGRMLPARTACRLVPQAFTHPACADGAFCIAPHPPPPPPSALMVVGRIIEAIRLGPQGPTAGPAFASWGPVLVRRLPRGRRHRAPPAWKEGRAEP